MQDGASPPVEADAAGEDGGNLGPDDVPLVPVTIRLPGDVRVMFLMSVTESIAELRSHLEDSPEACYYTQYHLAAGGRRVPESRAVGDVLETLEACGGFVDLVEDAYDERGARVHLRRLRRLFRHPPVARPGGDAPAEPPPAPAKAKAARAERPKGPDGVEPEKEKRVPPSTSLEAFFNALPEGVDSELRRAQRPLPPCLESIALSGWNPVPGYRRLVGDLFYVDVCTLEGKRLCVTASSRGFFVNQSGVPPSGPFRPDPAPKPPACSTLVALLGQVSPLFRENFDRLLASAEELHPLQLAEYPGPPVPDWLAAPVPPQKHSYDPGRAEESFFGRFDVENGAPREWNEEFQACIELPSDTYSARTLRDRATHRIYEDFLRAAVQGAREVVHGNLSPLSAEFDVPPEPAGDGEPIDDPPVDFYVYGNVFLSVARDDPLNPFRAAPATSGEQATRTSSNNDLRAIRELLRAEPHGLHYLATALVDYRGRRVVAQSIVPGILHGQRTAQVKYGSTDRGATVAADPEFHAAVLKAAETARLAEHAVLDAAGQRVTVAAHLDAKGIVGADGRRYLLDLTRFAPRDANWTDPADVYAVLRPELLAKFAAFKTQLHLQAHAKRRAAELKAAAKEAVDPASLPDAAGREARPARGPPGDRGAGKAEGEASGEKEEGPRRLERGVHCDLTPVPEAPPLLFNPDLLTPFKCAFGEDDKEEEERATALLKEAGAFIKERVIPQLVADLAEGDSMPLDGRMLTQQMHANGLNMRYLGAVAVVCARLVLRKAIPAASGPGVAPPAPQHVPAAPHLLALVELEMATRAAKHLLRRVVRTAPSHGVAPAVALFLNCLFGRVTEPPREERKEKKRDKREGGRRDSAQEAGRRGPTSATAWADVCVSVQRKFGYDLPLEEPWSALRFPKAALLRALCRSAGVVLVARDYDLEAPRPFRGEDVADLVPIVKHLDPRHEDGRRAMDAAMVHTSLGRLDAAYDCLRSAADMSFGVLGPLHPQNWNLLSLMGSTLYRLREVDAAAECHQRALIVAERCCGLDSTEALISMINLSNLQHMRGKRELAIGLMERALYLLLLSVGPLHPEVVQTYTHLAEMHGGAAVAKAGEKLKPPPLKPPPASAAGAGRGRGAAAAPPAAPASDPLVAFALRCLHEAVQLNEKIFGTVHPATASTYHALAVTLDGMGLVGLSVQHERRVVEILERTFGAGDIRTLEARAYLSAFTKRAEEGARALAALAGAPGGKAAAGRPGSGRGTQ